MANKLTNEMINVLAEICPVISSDIERYVTDWFGRKGFARIVARPESVQHLSAVLSFCNSKEISVNIIGGNTGLVGSCLSSSDEVAVSLEKLNRVLEIDTTSSIAVVESGVMLESLQNELSNHNMMTPYDLGSRGSCTIGGNISTNAGGNNFIRHGPLRGNVVGLEVVLASGEILDLMSKCRKDNTGYDLKQYFIGSEGTLGVITKAALYCPVQPRYKSVALLVGSDPSFANFVLSNLSRARSLLGETLTAFEFMDSQSIRLLPELPFTTPGNNGFGLLIECSSSVAPIDLALESFLQKATESDSSVSGVVSSDITGMRKLWHFRDTVSSAIARVGPNLKYDLSLPPDQYYEIVDAVRGEFGSDPRVEAVIGYGHVGDGNIHLNVALRQGESYTTPIGERISSFVFDRVKIAQGSISAEHGIGKDKVHALGYSKSAHAISIMHSVKRLFDPVGILNPARLLR